MLKGPIVVHGNIDRDLELIRRDCASVDMLSMIPIIEIKTYRDCKFGTGNIKGAFMKFGPIRREVYVRPQRGCLRRHGTLWKLPKLTYGMMHAGRKVMLIIERWMTKDYIPELL